jgi:hypothetical protein
MVGAFAQVGNFMSMVISGEWWKIKKRYLSLLSDRGDRSRKGREHERVFLRSLGIKK